MPHRRLAFSSSFQIVQLGLISVGGFVFWLAAVRRFSPETVGQASELVTLVLLVTYLTSLGLPITVARYANARSAAAERVFRWSVAATTAASAAGAAVIAVLAGSGVADPLVAHGRVVGGLVFFSAVNGFSIFTLLDHRQLALGAQRPVLVRSVIVAVLRLGIIVAPIPDSAFWLWLWMAASTPLALVLAAPFGRARPSTSALDRPTSEPVGLVRFSAVNYLSLLLSQAPVIVFPVVVVAGVPAEEAATFFVVWSIASTAFLVPTITGRALLVEGASTDQSLRSQAWFTVRAAALVSALMVVGSVVAALLIPVIYGSAYRDSRLILVVLMLGLLPFSVTATSLTFSRIRLRHAPNLLTSAVLAVSVVVGGSLATWRYGALGASVAWLGGHCLAAAVGLWGIAVDADSPRVDAVPAWRAWQPGSVLVAVVVGFLLAGPTGLLVAVAVALGHLLGLQRVAAITGALLMTGAAIATLIEGDLVASFRYADQRPVAAAMATFAVVVVAAASAMRLGEGRGHAERGARGRPSWRLPRPSRGAAFGAASFVASAAFVWFLDRTPMTAAELGAVADLTHRRFATVAPPPSTQLAGAPLGLLAVAHGPLGPSLFAVGALAGAVVLVAHFARALGRLRWLVAPCVCFPVLASPNSVAMLLALVVLLAGVGLLRGGRWFLFGVAVGVATLARPEALLAAGAWLVAGTALGLVAGVDRRRLAVSSMGASVVLAPWLVWLDGHGLLGSPLQLVDALQVAALTIPLLAVTVSVPRLGPPPRLAHTALDRAWVRGVATADRLVLLAIAVTALVVPVASGRGRYVAEFRFETAWAPVQALERFASLWHEVGGLGRPAGADLNPTALALFGGLRTVGLSPAVAQHVWHAALLAAAGAGVVVVVRSFRPSTGWVHLVAALAYMFSPLGLSLFVNSPIYLGALVIAPWLHAAILHGLGRSRGWRWPAVVALALFVALPTELPAVAYNLALLMPTVAFVVVVSRAATGWDLVVFGARTAALSALSVGFVVVRSLHGQGELLSRVALSETPQLVNAMSSASESARGLGSWLTYLRYGALTSRPHHAVLLESPLVVAATFLLPIGAFLYLAHRPRWLPGAFLALLASLSLMVVIGIYPAGDPSPWGVVVGFVYDHVPAAAAFRNTMKAGGPLLLAFSVLFAFGVVTVRRRLAKRPAWAHLFVGAVLVGLMTSSFPAWSGDLYNPIHQIDSVPAYWRDAFRWLDSPERGTGNTLVLPGSYATTYRWGHVGDDMFAALLERPHLRNSPFPQSTDETQDLIESIDAAAGEGDVGDESLAAVLRRLGVRYVVLRNDLDWQVMGRPRPWRYDFIREGGAFDLAASFGDPGRHTAVDADTSPAAERERQLPPVEVYELRQPVPPVRVVRGEPLLVSGDAEAWWQLAAEDRLRSERPVRYVAQLSDDDLAASLDVGAPLFLTDTNVRRERVATNGGSRTSSALAARMPTSGPAALFGDAAEQTTSWNAAGAVMTSSIPVLEQPWFRAANAFDGDPRTSWRTRATDDPRNAWLGVDLPAPAPVRRIALETLQREGGGSIGAGAVHTSDGQRVDFVVLDGRATVMLTGSPIDWLRIEITNVVGDGEGAVGFTDVVVDDLDLTEFRQLPHGLRDRARRSSAVAEAVARADTTYLFQREVRHGPAPVEMVLRRRFHVGEETRFRLRGSLTLDEGLDPLSEDVCGVTGAIVDGQIVPLAVTAREGTDDRYDFEACEPVDLAPGWHELSHPGSVAFDRVVLEPNDLEVAPADIDAAALVSATASGTERRYRVSDGTGGSGGGAYLMTGSAYGEGWTARDIDGRPLSVASLDTQTAVVLDGSGREIVELRYEPQRGYAVSVVAMLVGVSLCLWLVWRPRRRAPADAAANGEGRREEG